MINFSSISHIPKSSDAYAFDEKTLHVRLKTAKDVDSVTLWIGDPYIWAEGGLDGGNLGGSDAHGWIGGTKIEMRKEGVSEYHYHWIGYFEPPKSRARYGFILEAGDKQYLFGEKRIVDITEPKTAEVELSNLSNFYCFPYINKCDVLKTPKWVEDTVWYQIFPERFRSGDDSISPENVMPWGSTPTNDNFMGGDLWGVIEKLDYLQDLGVNGLYFCPIFHAVANHKYDTIDYFNVDPAFGGNEAFRQLVEEAHARGMKIMLDAVFNHVGANHEIWRDVVAKGKESDYADWFWIHDFPVVESYPCNYETFGNVTQMPKLNTENKACKEWLLSIAKHWVKEYNIDGWRLDVANEVDHKFWREFREEIKAINPDCYILGEIWHDGSAWLRGDQYDSLMNYPMTQSILDWLCANYTDKHGFMNDVTKSYVTYPHHVNQAMFNLLDSHDTSRIMSLCGNDVRKTKLAYLLMFTQVGSPCIYYGGEIGMDGMRGGGKEDNRKCMEWDESKHNLELKAFIKELIVLRKANREDFNSPTLEWLDVADDCVAYKRGKITVLINNSDSVKHVTLDGVNHELQEFGYKII